MKRVSAKNRVYKQYTLYLLGLFIAFSYFTSLKSYANTPNIIVNTPLSPHDVRYQYAYDLLILIVKETETDFGPTKIIQTPPIMTRTRTLLELEKGEVLNVMAEASQPIWDKQLLAVPIPIRRGIQGLRIFIVRDKNKNLLRNVSSISQLADIPTGVGQQWSILPAMEQAGFKLLKGSNYDGLFGMLAKDRFLTFNRGINEAYQELNQYQKIYADLIVDSHLLLHIPMVTYYYVSPKHPEIAQRIKTGLLRLIKNGQFDQFFAERICPDVALDSTQGARRVLKIYNPQYTEPAEQLIDDSFIFENYQQVLDACQVKP